MRTIAFVNQKGGTGKSTLAACLAVAAKDTGERVFLLDMDPQKSVIKWGYRRAAKDLPVEAVSAPKLPNVLAMLARSHVGTVLIDTPATDSPAAQSGHGCGRSLHHSRAADHLRHLVERNDARQVEDSGERLCLRAHPMRSRSGKRPRAGRCRGA